jgi:large subunit ribosomal protein L33
MRSIVAIECTQCKSKNYQTTRNKKNHQDRYELKKFCRHCRAHTKHKETK